MNLYNDWINKIQKLPFDKNFVCEVRDKDYIFLIKRRSFSFMVNIFKEKNGKYYLENYENGKYNFIFIEVCGDGNIDTLYRDNEMIKNEYYSAFKYKKYLDEIYFYENTELCFDELRFLKKRTITKKLKHKIIENESNYRHYSYNGKLVNEQFLNEDGCVIKSIDYNLTSEGIEKITLFKNGVEHCDNGPAVIKYDADGNIIEKIFYKNGKFIKNSAFPSAIEYIKGKVSAIYFYNENYQMHRDNFPAFYEFDYDENGKITFVQIAWFKNDEKNNKNGPAQIIFNVHLGNKILEKYFVDGEKADDLTAAVISANANEQYKKIKQNIIKVLKIEEE